LKRMTSNVSQGLMLAEIDTLLDISGLWDEIEAAPDVWTALKKLAEQSRSLEVGDIFDKLIQHRTWTTLLKKNPSWTERLALLKKRINTFQNIQAFCDAMLLQRSEDSDDYTVERIHLMTLHASKGLEFPVVFIVGCEDGLLPYRRKEQTDMAEENRLFYVGMTRAQQVLYLIQARQRYCFGKKVTNPVSPFVTAIEDALKRLHVSPRKQHKPPSTEEQITLF
jgi:superfamily I DNA/RNA helicase